MLKNIKQNIYQYYISDFGRQQYVYLRGKVLSLVLIVICNVQSTSIQLTSQIIEQIQDKNQSENYDSQSVSMLARIAHYFRIYPLIDSIISHQSHYNILNYFIITAAMFNSYILINQIVRFFIYKYKLTNNNYAKLSDIINSFILKIYVFVFYFPFNTACFEVFFSSESSLVEVILSVYTFILTLLISFMENLHDFSFSFVLDDYMASTDTHSKQLELVLNLILVVAFSTSQYINQNVISALHITFVSTKISLQLVELVYYDNLIIQTHLQFKLIHAFCSILFCLGFNFPYMFNGTQLIMAILSTLPFSYVIAKYLLFHRISDLALKKKNYNSLEQLNLHIRTAFYMVKHLEMHNYTDLRRSVLYESIYQNHYYTCAKNDCFCEQLLREDGFSWEELQGFQYRDQFISQYFAQMYLDYLNKIKANKQHQIKEYNETCFNYLTFLIEVVNVPTSALVEVVQIWNSEKSSSSIKNQMIYQQIYDHGEKIFYNFFNNPTIYNQKLQLNKVLEFDQLSLVTQKKLKESLNLLREMLITLCKEFVDLSQINGQVMKIKILKEEVESTIIKMYSYNPYSSRCQQLAEIFQKTLDLNNKRPQQYQKEAIFWNRKHINVNLYKDVPIFSQEACVIYISLIQPIGIIKNTSLSVQQMFGYSASELVNKNCNILIPDQLKLVHDRILNKFVKSGEMNGINAGQLQVFGINQSGFAIPINLRIRLDQSQSNDFGASAFFTYQNNQSSEFIIFSYEGSISNFTKNIYVELFANIISEGDLKLCQRLDIFKIIPILQTHFNQMAKGQYLSIEHTSILISPQTERAFRALMYQQNAPFNNIYDFLSICKKLNRKEFKFYSITFKVGRMKTSYKSFELGYIQIESLFQLKKKAEIKAHLREISTQFDKIKQYLELDQDIQNLNNTQSIVDFQGSNLKSPITNSSIQNKNHYDVKNTLTPKTQCNFNKRISVSTQASRKSNFGIQKHLSPFDFGISEEQENVLNQKEQALAYLTSNHLLNTNRRFFNGQQDNLQMNHDFTTEQSFDQPVNIKSSPILTSHLHNNHIDSKLILSNNEAIFEQEEQEDTFYNHTNIIENLFSSKSDTEDTDQAAQLNIQIPFDQQTQFKNNIQREKQKTQHKIDQLTTPKAQKNHHKNLSKIQNNSIERSQNVNQAINNEQNQSNSVNSTMSEYHTLKLTLLRAISKNHLSKILRVLYYIGYLKIFTLITLATFLYSYQQSQLHYIHTLNSNLVKGYEIMNEFVSIIAHTEYLKMYNQRIIQNTLTPEQLKYVQGEPLVIQQQFKDTVNSLENEDRSTWYGEYIRSQYQQIIVFNQRNISSTMKLKMIFSFVSMAENLFMYSQTQMEVCLRYIHYNQKGSIEIFQTMADLQKSEIESQIESMKSFQETSIIALEIFTLLMAIQVIPIYFYIQYKKEQILILFCTFQASQLQERIEKLEYFANKDIMKDSQEQLFVATDINNMKKRTISSTKGLQKINMSLLLTALFIFCFYSIYPIINYTINDQFIKEFSFTSNELSLIYSLRGKAPLILAFNFLRQTATYEERPQEILTGLNQQLQTTQEYISDTTNHIIQLLKDDSNKNLVFDKTLHQKIVETSMNENICKTLQNYQTKYLESSHQIDLADCETIQNGIWKNGYLLGLQSLKNILVDFQEMYKTPQTKDEFIISLQKYYKEYGGTSFIKIYQYIRVIPILIGNFIIQETSEFFDLYSYYSQGIFIFIILVASVTLLILWSQYYKYLVNSIYNTRQIYGFFPYEFIYKNPYIYNFVKNEYTI